MRALPLMEYKAAPTNGPFAQAATMLDAAAAIFEGNWLPAEFAKNLSIETDVVGSPTFEIDIYASNQDSPVNSYGITLGGSVTEGDTCALTVNNPNLPGGQQVVSYVAGSSDTLDTIASALAAAINANAALQALGYGATVSGAVVTISWPSGQPTEIGQTGPAQQNFTTVSGASTASGGGAGSETFTVALGSGGVKVGDITAAGYTNLASDVLPARWIKARLSSFSGSGDSVSAYLAGVG